MPLVWKTRKDDPYPHEIVGVGTAGPNGKGGIPVEAGVGVMGELVKRTKEGRAVRDDQGELEYMTGAELAKAARTFADERGLEVVNVSEEQIAEFPQEVGSPPDPPMTARERSLAAGARDRKQIEDSARHMGVLREEQEAEEDLRMKETGPRKGGDE
jgi:hypothetical protein